MKKNFFKKWLKIQKCLRKKSRGKKSCETVPLSQRGVAGADTSWSLPVPYSQSADITGPTHISKMFNDALPAFSRGNVTLFWLPQILVLNCSIQFLITKNNNMHTSTYINITEHLTGGMGLTVHRPFMSSTSTRYEHDRQGSNN